MKRSGIEARSGKDLATKEKEFMMVVL